MNTLPVTDLRYYPSFSQPLLKMVLVLLIIYILSPLLVIRLFSKKMRSHDPLQLSSNTLNMHITQRLGTHHE